MDVHCTTCNEPWDIYHLRHEAIFETDLSPEEAEHWTTLSFRKRLSDRFREKFLGAGYEFGASVYVLMRCPVCPKGASPDPDKAALKTGLAEIFGDDEDGLAVKLEDWGL
jgi:hypothetical protein